jgi:hypothetical protein
MKGLRTVLAKLKNTTAFKRFALRFQTEKLRPISNSLFDLAPIDAADHDGIYREALSFAMLNTSVRNIAITGPYGSGKTSVIKTFERHCSYRFLNVSLATFNDPNLPDTSQPDIDQTDVTIKVERSILQQMLYGAGAGTLPYSRFKRISRPRWMDLNAALFVGWVAVLGLLYQNRDDLLKAFNNQSMEWVWIFAVAYALLYLARLVSKALQASHSLSVKKLSLQSGEIELDGLPESSILNKHLDEIIYFFEENNYDLVVFEDLDRFGNPEIFIKLREINKIINDRPLRKTRLSYLRRIQPLKFAYAIKDDIFLNKDRAKFFDFIVPIIPVINNSNSREILRKCIEAAGYADNVKERFIGEVSLYLDDMRLIKNISNEFLIYEKKIGSAQLNIDRLLAAIIYKNAYPKDFESLHHASGALYEIVRARTSILIASAQSLDLQIDTLRKLLAEAEKEVCSNVSELIKLFWGHLCTTYEEYDIVSIYADQTPFTASQLLDWGSFEKLFREKNINVQVRQRGGYHYEQKISLPVSFKALEETIMPGTTFKARRGNIANQKAKSQAAINAQIAALKDEKSSLVRQPLSKLLSQAEFDIKEVAAQHNINDARLLNYLICNGYIDETYHLYISTFHEGRMSRNDWDFILAVRDFRTPDPASRLDNPSEVVDELREEDFSSNYALNVNLIDYLLDSGDTEHARIRRVIGYISKHLAKESEFFEAYWIVGKSNARLTTIICKYWPSFAVAAIDGALATQHIARIIAQVEPAFVQAKMNANGTLAQYISKNAAVIFSVNVIFEQGFQALKLLGVKVENLAQCSHCIDLVKYAHENNLYRITVENINCILANFGVTDTSDVAIGLNDPQRAHYTTLLNFGSEPLRSYIDGHINNYLRNVACVIDGNNLESPSAIASIANHPKVDKDLAIQFTLQQLHVFSVLDELPAYQWSELVYNQRVELTWANLLSLYAHGQYDENRLCELFDRPEVYSALSLQKIPTTLLDASKGLNWFLVSNQNLSEASYTALCKSISYCYETFPEDFPEARSLILVSQGLVLLSEASFDETEHSGVLRAKLIEINFTTYISSSDDYPLDSDIKSLLLTSTLSITQKCFILSGVTLAELQANAALARRAGQLFARLDLEDRDFDLAVVSHCLAYAPEKSERLDILYNFVDLLPCTEILSAFSALDTPYSDLTSPGMRPKLENTERNRRFAKSLADRRIISSQKPNGDYIKLNTFR